MIFPQFTPDPRPPISEACNAAIPGSGVTTLCSQSLCAGQCINGVINFGSLPTFYVGKPVSIQLTAIGTPPFSWVATSGLPGGLTLSASGLLSGTPTTAATGNLVATLTNCGSASTSKTLAWTVTACTVPSAITPSSLTGVTAGAAFSASIAATGTSLVFTAVGMPPGMTLDSNTGALAWASPVQGTWTFTVYATNSCGVTSKEYTLTITAGITFRSGAWHGAAAPTFVASDFTGPSANFETMVNEARSTRFGSFVFPAKAGVPSVYDVFWIADSLLGGTPMFNALRSPVILRPTVDASYQSLTIQGIPGKVFITYGTADTGQTIDIT